MKHQPEQSMMNRDQTTVTQGETKVVIDHTGHSQLHIHLHFTVVAASQETLDKIAQVEKSLKTSGDALNAATDAAV